MAPSTAPVDPSLLPAVRSAQGALVRSIFSHPAFDAEGERRCGKVFYVFEETVANNEALEVAHLGDDVDSATRAALDIAVQNCRQFAADGSEGQGYGELLKLARRKYADEGRDVEGLEDVDLGEEVKGKAGAVRDAAEKALVG